MAFSRFDADVTARDRAYAAMLANISDVIAIIDHQGLIRFKSENVREIFGWQSEELVGQPAFENVHPDDRHHIQQRFTSLLDTPKTVMTDECRYRHADGTYRWIRYSAVNKLEDPMLRGILLNYRDITEERRTQERFRVTFEDAPVGMFLADDENRIVEANRAAEELLGYGAGELTGLRGHDLIHPDDLARVPMESVMEQVHSNRATIEIDNKFRTKRGAYIDVHVRVGRIDLEDRSASHIVQFYDITRRTRAEQRVQALLEEKDVLLQEVHHRIKNDLSLVHALLSTQARTVGPEAAQALQEAGSRVGVMARVYQRLQNTVGLTDVALPSVIGGLVEDLKRGFVPETIAIRSDIEPVSIPARLGVSLGIVANELITNAVKYAFVPDQQPQEIVVVGRRGEADGSLELVVRDTGTGFSDDVLSGEQSGYGLMIARALVAQHHGTIALENDGGGVVKITVSTAAE
ncbi:MAG: sensor histidine kinase [Alkalispirochaeta sp.]